jgi:hypothetical protein
MTAEPIGDDLREVYRERLAYIASAFPVRSPLNAAENIFDRSILPVIQDEREFSRVGLRLKTFCDALVNTDVKLEHGYSIGFKPNLSVHYPPPGITRVDFPQPTLVLKDPEGNSVGQVSFRVGTTPVIAEIQGIHGRSPLEFYRKTGRHFEEPLIDHFLCLTSRHLGVGTGRGQRQERAVFSSEAFSGMMTSLRNRILSNYCHASAIPRLPREKLNQRMLRVTPAAIKRARKRTAFAR